MIRRAALVIVSFLTICAYAHAQAPDFCARQAQDYAAMVAPLTGGGLFKSAPQGYVQSGNAAAGSGRAQT